MSKELQSQWPCPYCFQPFPSSGELRSHLEADRLQKILAEIQKVLLNQTCSASGDILNREEIDKYPSQSPESSIEVRIAKPLDLTCPHVDCKDTERVIYTKKPNLLRHYQSHITCHAKCPFCDATFSRLRQWVKHFDKCKKGRGLNGRHSAASRLKRDLCHLASEQLDQQLEARAALELRTKKETQSEEGIQEQADPVAEDNSWEEDGGNSSGSPNATYDRPRKRQRTETHSSASSDGSELGISMGQRVHLQSQSETDPCEGVRSTQKGESTTNLMELEQQINYAVYPVHPDGWEESVFAAEDFNRNRPNEFRAVPIHPDGWAGAVFAGEDLGMYATIPVHPDLWLQSGFPVPDVDWPQSVIEDGTSSKTALGV
ncbi:hypothetical protein F5882DRAFT_400107, partial [Hyaloscypha sp. PMI_1271]